jgi:phage terminase large subunit GpA-like protein
MQNPLDRVRAAFVPKPVIKMHLDVWTDTKRHLGASVAAKPGKMRLSNVEAARGVHRAITAEKSAETVTVCVSTQLFKSELLLNIIGYHADLDPCPMLMVQPKVDSARAFSKERIAGMIAATPVLAEIFGNTRQDQSESSQFYKEFAGGFLSLASAGSPIELAMRPIRITLMDEIDKYEATREGDPVMLGEERTATFSGSRALHVRCSSPTLEDDSRIWESYKSSDMRRPFLTCCHCSQTFTPEWAKNAHWPKGKDDEHLTSQATFTCDSGCVISPAERHKMLTTEGDVKWHQTKPFTCCGIEQQPLTTRAWEWDSERMCGFAICTECGRRAMPNPTHIGFNGNKLVSPWPDAEIVKLAEKWISVQNDTLAKQVFYNSALGLPFQAHDKQRLDAHILQERLEQFPPKLPKEVVRITSGVDCQKDRLEICTVGYSEFYEAWSLDHHIIQGSPEDKRTWEELDEYILNCEFPSAWGPPLPIAAVGVDCGYASQHCYNYCLPRKPRNVFPLKGSSQNSARGAPIWPVPEVREKKSQGRVRKQYQPAEMPAFRPYVVNVDGAKDFLRSMILNDTPGPNYLHLPLGKSNEFLAQLVCEFPVFERKGGTTIRKWYTPRNARNEIADCHVYSLCALEGLRALRKLDMHKLANVTIPQYVAKLEIQNVR